MAVLLGEAQMIYRLELEPGQQGLDIRFTVFAAHGAVRAGGC